MDVINKDEAESTLHEELAALQQEFDLFDTDEPDEAKSTLQQKLAVMRKI